MVEVDLGVALGLAGIATGLGSVAYARTQAGAARRQAEEARRAAMVDVNRTMTDHVREIRRRLIEEPALWREYAQANPTIADAYGESPRAGLVIRDFLDATEDVYFLRKEGVVDDHYWRNWVSSTLPVTRLPTFQRIFANAVQRGAWQPEFVAFLKAAAAGNPSDPLGRVELKASAPAPSPSPPPP